MIYSWKIPEKFLNRDIGEYDRSCSPNYFLLNAGKVLEAFFPIPTVNFIVKKERVLKFDCLPNDSLVPLVNNKVKALLEALAPNDVQFFEAKLKCTDGELKGYYFLNVISTIVGIDHEKSIYSKMKTVDAILGFTYLTYKKGCMGDHHVARDDEYHQNLLLSETIKQAFDKEHITGVWLVRPEEFYRPFTAADLVNGPAE